MTRMQELYEKVGKDSGLQAQFSQIMADAEQAGKTATEEKLLAFAREAGFEVIIQEMQAFFQGMAAQAEGELFDAELDQVAGGKSSNGALAIVESVISFGIACALNSISAAISKLDCAAKYQ